MVLALWCVSDKNAYLKGDKNDPQPLLRPRETGQAASLLISTYRVPRHSLKLYA